jgi:hypothetical protein
LQRGQAAAILQEECPDVAVTLSHRLGRIGLLERENAALLNACLVQLAMKTTRAFTTALRASGIAAPLYLTQNDGTVMLAEVDAYPVYSLAGADQLDGAAFLSRRDEALVDGGHHHRYRQPPARLRRANNVVEIGVRTLFRRPTCLAGSRRRTLAGRPRPPSAGQRDIASPSRRSSSAETSSPSPTSRWPPGSSIWATASASPRCRPSWWRTLSRASAP